MIRSFRHRGLQELWESGDTKLISPDLKRRTRVKLASLNIAQSLAELRPFGVHRLHGDEDGRFAITVNGPWRIVFTWDAETGDAELVDFRQYH